MGTGKTVLIVIVPLTLVLFIIYSLVGATTHYSGFHDGLFGKKHMNMNTKVKTTETNTPPIIIQYGMPRTATTLQFSILCAIIALQHISELENVGCFYNKISFKKMPKYSVIKTHRIKYYLDVVPPGTWVVTTEDKTGQRNLKSEIKATRPNISVPLSIKFSDVKVFGASIVYKYQSLFDVSDENIYHLLNHFKLWDILRICCGRQMSRKWRAFLVNKTDSLSSLSPCLMYNISEIEKRFINSYMFKLFSDKPSIRSVLIKPSLVDGKLNGSYCKTCNTNIALNKIEHNKRCV